MTTNQTIDGVQMLPCPFCGSAPIEQKWLPEGCGTGDVVCSNDDCAISGFDGIPHEQWNKRAPAPVAVSIDDNVEFEKWWMSTPILRKQKIQIAQEAWFARASLSK